jgi:hypothetical protein
MAISFPIFRSLPLILCLLIVSTSQTLFGQMQLHSISPTAWLVGSKNRVTLTGANLPTDARLLFTEKLEYKILSATSEKVEVEIDVPAGMAPTEAGVWLAGDASVSPAQHIVLDILPYFSEGQYLADHKQDNHSFDKAITVSFPAVIEGMVDSSQSDFYRFYALEGDILTFDVLAQRLGSNMDSFVKLYDSEKKLVANADDTELGPDSSFSCTIRKSGWYVIEVRDNRYLGGAKYLIRVTPTQPVSSELPLVANSPPLPGISLSDPAGTPHWRIPSIDPYAFPAMVLESPYKVLSELDPQLSQSVSPHQETPFIIAGAFASESETDMFWFHGKPGQTIRVTNKTRSLGSPAYLKVEVWKDGVTKIADSPVNEHEEWSMDLALPQEGAYQLRVTDLLRRGGTTFKYAIEIKDKNDFEVAWKVDPKSTDGRIAATQSGAVAVDLVVQRYGYDGPIEIRCTEPEGWAVINPRIESKQVAARCIVQAPKDWKAGDLQRLHLEAAPSSQENPSASRLSSRAVSNLAWLRAKNPQMPYPPIWKQHRWVVTAGNISDDPVEVHLGSAMRKSRDVEAIVWKIPLHGQNFTLPPGSEFPALQLESGWSARGSLDKEHLLISLKRTSKDSGTFPASFAIPFYYEVQGKGRLGKVHLPMEWFDAPERIESFPSQIVIHRNRDQQRLAVTGWDRFDSARDWSEYIEWECSDPKIGEIRSGVFYPKEIGNGKLIGKLGKLTVTVPVQVAATETASSVEFENEVLVALSKQGCNSGACHGSPSGKGGFRLSLRAFDKELDSFTLVQEHAGRRVNTLEPDESLLIKKGMMKVSHGGGMQLRKEDAAYRILRDWIAGGATLDPPEASRCVKLSVYPNDERTLSIHSGAQQLVVMAEFANGKTRDVTELVSYESSSSTVATVSKHGLVTPKTQGETVILVRFLEHIESIPFVYLDSKPDFQWVQQPERNWIDQLVDNKLKQFQINASGECDDSTFLRRTSLDILGQLPTQEETRAFLSSVDKNKRARWIDQLLDRPEHASFWALQWSDLLRVTAKGVTDEGAHKFHRWIEDSIAANKPYDQFARELLLSKGSTFLHPEANFFRTAKDAQESVETVSQLFLGARLQCAKCHNHPFERWTQDNYYGLSAFFNRVQRKSTTRPNEMWIWTSDQGEIQQPRTGQVMSPWVPGDLPLPEQSEDRRRGFVEWLVNPNNPFFARVEANRVWSHLFARGIVDPIDDFRDSNPPTNKPLLDALAKFFVESGYDRKALLRAILNSRTYQADFATNESNSTDSLYFSHQEPRLLGAEPLLDAVNHLLGTQQRFGGLPDGTKATQIPAPDLAKLDFLRVFGQPERSTVCACERSEESNLGMAIELFNGALLYEKLRDPNNRFRNMLRSGSSVETIIKDLYLTGFCREPSDEELQKCLTHCKSKESLEAGLEDLCWVLLNTDEFLFQH